MGTLLRGGKVFDGTGAPPAASDVLIQDGRIAPVGPPASPAGPSVSAAGVTVLDVSGCTVLPGLINLHEHQVFAGVVGPWEAIITVPDSTLLLRAARRASLALRQGVTAVRDLGAPRGVNLTMRSARDAGLVVSPRIAAAGSPIAITGGHAYEMCVEADGPEGFAAAVRAQIRAGADWIKLMASGGLTRGVVSLSRFFALQPSPAELRAAIDAAHAMGRPVTAHVNGTEAIRACVEGGIDGIEHGVGITEDLAAEMARRDVVLTPTLSIYFRSAERAAEWGRPKDQVDLSRQIVARHREGLRFALKHGVRIGLGTDSIGDMAEEAALLHEVGLSPAQVLRAATLGAAEVLGWEAWLGSVQPGKAADLLVVEGDPAADLGALRRVRHVFLDGRMVTPAHLPVELST
ncbi:MAG: amidohydrolase family protein [Armatimonadetes bacterium]|nr:amidohydrolase family protein [Armatimonadota bacterium]